MRRRAAWVLPTALIAGVALVVPLAPARAGRPSDPPAVRLAARRQSAVTLPTGEHVRLTGAPGRQRVLVDHAGARGPGRTLLTHRLRSHVYVMPAVAEPYLGHFLDPDLFDVTRLAATKTVSGRLPVRISYRGSSPAVPGVHITSAAGGSARGYLTTTSAATFGRALTDQWRADNAAGWPQRATLFTGVTRITADVPAPGQVKPHYPMYTLRVKAVGPDGKPQTDGAVVLVNVDDGRKYSGFVIPEDGEARVSVPKGHYGAIGVDFTFNDKDGSSKLRLTTVNEFVVSGSGQTLTVDHRLATIRPTQTVPRPATRLDGFVDYERGDAADVASVGFGFFVDGMTDVALAPAATPKVGTVSLLQSWTLAQPGVAVPTYTYAVASLTKRIPARMDLTFAPDQLAVVHAAYYGDGSRPDAAFTRIPFYDEGSSGGSYEDVPRATRRTEYVGATGSPTWLDSAILNLESFDDPGFVDGTERSLLARSSTAVNWFRGPLAPGIPVQRGPGYCFGCRSGNTLGLSLAPFIDSDPTHAGIIFGAEDGLPVARFRLYRNGKLVSDEDDSLGGDFKVKAGKATYKAILDIDRRLSNPAQSTRSQTQITFSSAKNAGKKLTEDWYCDGDNCRVLPIVQAWVALPTDLNGRLPVGKSNVTVTVARAQNAKASAATSAQLEFRPAGYGWSTVRLTAIGGGKYRGVITNAIDYAGTDVDVRVSGSDRGGSTFSQTVLRAYSVVG